MVKEVRMAYAAAKKAQESLYFGTMTVTEHHKSRDERTRLTTERDVVVLEGQPCKLSFETQKSVQQTESAAEAAQSIKLFVSPEITIKPGSKITVTQDGVTADYTYSSVPAVYPTHQEIILELFRRWA